MRPICFFVLAAAAGLAGCDNTMYGVGQDMQQAGSTLSEKARPAPAPPPLSSGPGYRQYDDSPLIEEGYPPYRSSQ